MQKDYDQRTYNKKIKAPETVEQNGTRYYFYFVHVSNCLIAAEYAVAHEHHQLPVYSNVNFATTTIHFVQ